MDHTLSRERIVDLESGGSSISEEDRNIDQVPRVRQMQNLLGRVWSGAVSSDGSVKGEDGVNSCYGVTPPVVTIENSEFVVDKKSEGEETEGLLEQNFTNDKRKKLSPKRSPKPPRPPKGPSLDAADQKLIKEISELIMLKRARNERVRAMKKMKASKGSSSNAGLFAMIITVFFCLLFIFFPGNSSSQVSFKGSPEPALATSGGLISVQYSKNISADGNDGPGSSYRTYIEQVSESSHQRKQEALKDEMGSSGEG